jgi:hypothetical protein
MVVEEEEDDTLRQVRDDKVFLLLPLLIPLLLLSPVGLWRVFKNLLAVDDDANNKRDDDDEK